MQALAGYKTYIVAAATVLFALASYWNGGLSFDQAMGMVLGGAGLGALRNAVPPGGN